MLLSSETGSLALLGPEDESITILQQSTRNYIPGNLKSPPYLFLVALLSRTFYVPARLYVISKNCTLTSVPN